MNNKEKATRLREIKSAFDAVMPFLEGDVFHKHMKEWTEESRAALNFAILLAVDSKALIEEMASKYGLGKTDIKSFVLNSLDTHVSVKMDGNDKILYQYDWQWYFRKQAAYERNFVEELGNWADLIENEPDEDSGAEEVYESIQLSLTNLEVLEKLEDNIRMNRADIHGSFPSEGEWAISDWQIRKSLETLENYKLIERSDNKPRSGYVRTKKGKEFIEFQKHK